jgi:hypothetical protein
LTDPAVHMATPRTPADFIHVALTERVAGSSYQY